MSAPPLSTHLRARLSLMMFLQYAIWSAWIPLFVPFLTEHRGIAPRDVGLLFAIGSLGGLTTPFFAAQIADRWLNAEKLLAILHFTGALLVWQLARAESFGALLATCVLYSMIYSPTMPLTNALAFTHLPDRDRDFGKIRMWGTIGGIVAAIGVGQWLLHQHTPPEGTPAAIRAVQVAGMSDAFRFSGLIGLAQALFCLTLPATPPRRGPKKFAPAQAAQRFRERPLSMLLLVAFVTSCMHQFYLFHSSGFLSRLDHPWTPTINKIFGVGGGGLMSIGHMAEILVLSIMPFVAKRLERKTLLTIGLLAYIARFAVFAYFPTPVAVIPALVLQGLCFGCFFFVAFMIVDEETTPDIRASAQAVFNIVAFGIAVIVGGMVAALVAQAAQGNYTVLFGTAMWICIASLGFLLLLYPRRREHAAAAVPVTGTAQS